MCGSISVPRGAIQINAYGTVFEARVVLLKLLRATSLSESDSLGWLCSSSAFSHRTE